MSMEADFIVGGSALAEPQYRPLSWQQQWLWSALQADPGWRCKVVYVFGMYGILDVPLLARGVEEVIQRHDSLRARITTLDSLAVAYIQDSVNVPLDPLIITGGSAREREANGRSWVETFGDQPIDPLRDPLLDVRLLEIGPHEHWLVLALHRLIGDCASIDLLFQEIWAFYSAMACGQPLPFTRAATSYYDYASRQHETEADWQKRHGPYWQKRLAQANPLEWPLDAAACATARDQLGRMNILLGEHLSTELRDLARRQRTLLANVALAVYVVALSRWCHQQDFVVPFFVAGRQSEHKATIGYFSHALLLRVSLQPGQTLIGLLGQVANEFFGALSHQDFGRLARQMPELLTGSFCQWVTWHSDSREGMTMAAPNGQEVPAVRRVTIKDYGEDLTALPPGRVAVEISFFDSGQGIYASGVYRADLFSGSTMQRFMQTLRVTAEEFVREPNALVASPWSLICHEYDAHA
ncbi:MAG TPA: condensation domain-containing protein [Steroidobacteraceae bacterium]